MANSLKRDIEKGEAVILREHPDRRFIVTTGYGRFARTSGIALWGFFEDSRDAEIGPLDAVDAIDVDATDRLNTQFVQD